MYVSWRGLRSQPARDSVCKGTLLMVNKLIGASIGIPLVWAPNGLSRDPDEIN